MQLDLKDYNAFTFIPYLVEFDINCDTDRTWFCIGIYFLNFFLNKFQSVIFSFSFVLPISINISNIIRTSQMQNSMILILHVYSIAYKLLYTTYQLAKKKRKGWLDFLFATVFAWTVTRALQTYDDQTTSLIFYMYIYMYGYICACVYL